MDEDRNNFRMRGASFNHADTTGLSYGDYSTSQSSHLQEPISDSTPPPSHNPKSSSGLGFWSGLAIALALGAGIFFCWESNQLNNQISDLTLQSEHFQQTLDSKAFVNKQGDQITGTSETPSSISSTITAQPNQNTIIILGDSSGNTSFALKNSNGLDVASLNSLGNFGLDGTIICTNCIALGSETTGNYVKGLRAGSDIIIFDPSGEGTTPTIFNISTLDSVTARGATTNHAIAINVSGNALTLNDPNAAIAFNTGVGRLYDSSGNLYYNSTNLTAGGALPVGTSGQTLYNNGTSWTAASNLYNNGTNIGINTTSPDRSLDVVGGLRGNAINFWPKSRPPLVTFEFDDGYATTYTLMKPVLDARHVVGVNAVVTDMIDYNVGHITPAQLQEMNAAGWETANHTKSHPHLTTLTESQIRSEFVDANTFLNTLGINTTTCVYPWHESDTTVRRVAREYFRACRGGPQAINSYPLNSYQLSSYLMNPTQLALYESYVDAAQTNSQWLIFYMHTATPADVTFVSALIDYIQAKNIAIVTASQALSQVENEIDVGDGFAASSDGGISVGYGLSVASSTLSSGSLANLTVTGTAAASNTQKALNISTSGANATSTQTTYGLYASNTHTGTSSTNVGLYASASGATNNYAAIFNAGNVGIGTTTPTAKLTLNAGNFALTSGTSFGTARNNAAIEILGSLAGRVENNNTDFLSGTTSGYSVYNNLGNGTVTFAIEDDAEAPNSSGYRLKISYAGGGASPGFGGYIAGSYSKMDYVNAYNKYRPGTRSVIRIWANIPSGRNINFTGSGWGTGGNFVWLTSNTGTGQWQEYIGVQTIGIGGSYNISGCIYISGGADAAFNWYVASYEIVAVDEADSTNRAMSLNVGYKRGVDLGFGSLLSTQATYLATDGGNVGIGDTTPAALLTVGDGDLFQVNGSGVIAAAAGITSSGTITFSGLGSSAVAGTAIHIDGSNNLFKYTSSLRYKTDVTNLEIDTNKLYDLRPASYRPNESNTRDFGLIAEEVAQTIPQLVIYDSLGRPDSVRYDSLSVLLLNELQKQHKDIENIKTQISGSDSSGAITITSLSSQVSALSSKVDVYDSVVGWIDSLKAAVEINGVNAKVLGDLAVVGALNISGNATFGGNIKVEGHTILSGDTVGEATFAPDENQVEIKYAKSYDKKPMVFVSTNGQAIEFSVENETTEGFIIKLLKPAERELKLNWMVIGVE